MKRFRIITRNPDGSLGSEPPQPLAGNIPFPRGKNLSIVVINEDGSTSPVPNVKSVSINCAGRMHAIEATVTFVGVELDVTALEDNDPIKVAMLQARHWEAEARTAQQALDLKYDETEKFWKERDAIEEAVAAAQERLGDPNLNSGAILTTLLDEIALAVKS